LFQIEAKNLLFELRLVTIVCHCNISLDYVCILPNYTQVLQLNYIRSQFKDYVINPTHKLVFINPEGFEEFLRWKQRAEK
ncbi:TPA: hypothetical protein ACGO9K_001312, partial [Streptococcus suis]